MPSIATPIQREAVKRMFRTLPTLGIEFAKEGAAVIVHAAPAAAEGAAAEGAGTPAVRTAGLAPAAA